MSHIQIGIKTTYQLHVIDPLKLEVVSSDVKPEHVSLCPNEGGHILGHPFSYEVEIVVDPIIDAALGRHLEGLEHEREDIWHLLDVVSQFFGLHSNRKLAFARSVHVHICSHCTLLDVVVGDFWDLVG